MKAASLIVVGTTLALILALFLYVDPAEASPRKGGGGFSRPGGSSWSGGGSKNKGYGGSTSCGSCGYKKKGITTHLQMLFDRELISNYICTTQFDSSTLDALDILVVILRLVSMLKLKVSQNSENIAKV